MADHQAESRAMANPEIDITNLYAFPSPEQPGNLVLVMNVFPGATLSTLFQTRSTTGSGYAAEVDTLTCHLDFRCVVRWFSEISCVTMASPS